MLIVKLSNPKITRKYKTVKIYNGIFLHLKGEYYTPYFMNPPLMTKLLEVYDKKLIPKLLEDEQKYHIQYKQTVKEIIPVYNKTHDYYTDRETELLINTITGILDLPEATTNKKVFTTAKETLNTIHLADFFMNKNFKMYYITSDDKILILPQLNLVLTTIESGKISVFREKTLKQYMLNHTHNTSIPFELTLLPYSHPFYAVYLAGNTLNKARLFKIITLTKQGTPTSNITVSENLQEMPDYEASTKYVIPPGMYYLPAIDYYLQVVKPFGKHKNPAKVYIYNNITAKYYTEGHIKELTKIDCNCSRYEKGYTMNNTEHRLCNSTKTRKRALEIMKRINELTPIHKKNK